MKTGFVYVVEADGRFKIGCTKQPIAARMAQLQTGCPVLLKLICAIPSNDPYLLERGLHVRFASQRADNEWFDLNDRDFEYLATLADLGDYLPTRIIVRVAPQVTINTLGLGRRLCE